MIIKITKKNSGERLDKFLTNRDAIWKSKLSRSQIQQLIEQGTILVNNLLATSHCRLKPGDIINVKKIGKKENQTNTDNNRDNKLKEPIEIIKETAEFLVINKPAGLAVHGQGNYTLADWLKAKYPQIKKIGDDPERPGIVHRLDKDVSGLMVIAKTQAAFDNLKNQFQDRTIIKEYTALVYGKIQKDNGIINFPIKRAKDGYKMAAIPLTVKGQPAQEGRLAETQFWIKTRFINYTLLKIRIKTGRTHQIRVHLSAYDHPLAGDKAYGTAKTRRQNKKLGLNRIFLIADHLSFTDLTGQRTDLRIGLTEELKNILNIVK